MLSALLEGSLYFSHIPAVLIIIMTGWLFYNKPLFFYAACLSCISIIINVALKGTFKVPLPPNLHPGYAFPSGHMQFATVFYGWLFYHINHRGIRMIIVVLLICLGISMIQHHYHNLAEILAGLATGLLLIQLFIIVLKRYEQNILAILLTLSCYVMIYNYAVYSKIPVHTWYAWAFLALLMLFKYFFSHRPDFFSMKRGRQNLSG